MTWIITKYLITASIVVLVTELAKRSGKTGGLVAALPLVTILTLIWLYIEKQPQERMVNFSRYTFWYVLPTLPLFLIFPVLLPKFGFVVALFSCMLITICCFGILALLVRHIGIDLL